MRTLAGAEAELVRGALGMMVDTHVAELREEAEPWQYGVLWFDQWEAGQRLWLLEQVAGALLNTEVIEPPAAIFEAAVDAILFEIADLVEMEIQDVACSGPTASAPNLAGPAPSWRQSVREAFRWQTGRTPPLSTSCEDAAQWRRLVTQLGDAILGVRLYRKAEPFRDGQYSHLQRFLQQRGLPEDYLSRIPPLPGRGRIQRSIDRLQTLVLG
jgi:hypothetical protein